MVDDCREPVSTVTVKRIRINATFSTSITITVSEPGDGATVVPNVVGLSEAAAVEQLSSLGLVTHVEEIDSGEGSSNSGVVISQRPRANEDVPAGTHVFLQVSMRPLVEPNPEESTSE